MSIDVEDMVRVLNEAVTADPIAMWQLRCVTIPVNQQLADHRSIQVGSNPLGNNTFHMRVIGLLNGFLTGTGKRIAEMYDEEPNDVGYRRFLGYTVVEV
jgi:hypothetical protein